MKSTLVLAAMLLPSLLLVGCTNDSSTAAVADDDDDGSSFDLTAGTYDYVIDTVPADTCWAPPKTNPTLPMALVADVTINGNDIQVTPQTDGTIPTQTFTITKNGNALTGISDGDADLNAQGIDCILHIAATFDGTMTAKDAFEAVQVINVSQVSGPACGLLVGNLDANQLDQLPCSLTLEGAATIQ